MMSLGHANIFFGFIEKTVWYSLYHRMIKLDKWIRSGPECGTAHGRTKGLLFEREDGCLDPTLRHPKTKTLWKPNQFTFWISKQWRQFSVIFFVFWIQITFLLANPYVCGSGSLFEYAFCWWVAYPYRPSVTSVYLLLLLKSHSCWLDHARSYFVGHIVI
jgi:hypothetical protein